MLPALPLAKVIHDNISTTKRCMTTMHDIIPTQNIMEDTFGKLQHDDHWADSISVSTGIAKVVRKFMAELNGYLIGMVF